jgi:hypothetical protein
MGVGEAALLSAALGGGTAAMQGRDPLKGAILGGLGGAAFGGLSSALSGSMPGAAAAGAEAAGAAAGSVQPALAAGQTYSAMGNVVPATAPLNTLVDAAPAAKLGFFDSPTEWWKGLSPTQKMLYGGGAGLGLMALTNRGSSMPMQETYTGPLSRFRYDPDIFRPSLQMADGGIASLGQQNMLVGGGPLRTPPLGNDGGLDWQRRSEAVTRMRSGGASDLGGYSDGGRLLKGPGDGMSDNIPATIAEKRPARLADGEFVIPADVVSHLGNGSTDAGAKQLYSMMDRVRQSRTGNKKQGREIKPQKFLPA